MTSSLPASAARVFARLSLRQGRPTAQNLGRTLATSASQRLPSTTIESASNISHDPLVAGSSSTALSATGSQSSVRRPNSTRRVRSVETQKVHQVQTRVGRARQILQWNWLSPEQLSEVAQAMEAPKPESALPSWLTSEHEAAKSFRSARSRLWIPAVIPEAVAGGPLPEGQATAGWVDEQVVGLAETLQGQARKRFLSLTAEEQRDEVLRDVWKAMSNTERKNANLECRFSCLRNLGWRTGYSAGYPITESSTFAAKRAELVPALGRPGDDGAAALLELREQDEELAWQAWVEMSPQQREAEERIAWDSRDRSSLFIDDSPTSTVLGGAMPRWYSVPQRAGELIFLPNHVVRLVRNYTPKGKPYDAWKATFRVPLNLHKHLVKSYLLAVYGLRTTWIRSMVYRSPAMRRRQGFTRSVVTGKGRTFKKIEVGLLEPFVFPAISPETRRTQLFDSEGLAIRQELYLRMTGRRRWRAGRQPEPTRGEAEEEAELIKVDPEDSKKAAGSEGANKRPALIALNGRIPTKKHSTILRLLSEKRKERMAAVDRRAAEMKQEQDSAAETAAAGRD